MYPSKLLSIFLLFVFLICCLTACSKSGDNPAQPVIEPVDQSFGSETDERNLIAVYDAVIDPDAGTFEITSVERQGVISLSIDPTISRCSSNRRIWF